MEAITFIVLAFFTILVLALGEWLFRRFTDRLDARLHAGWRWLTLPITVIVSWAGFVAIRPFVLDQPPGPLWFVLAMVAMTLLVVAGTAFVWALVALGKWLLP